MCVVWATFPLGIYTNKGVKDETLNNTCRRSCLRGKNKKTTLNYEEVTCLKCKGTEYYNHIKEVNRPFEEGEFELPFEVKENKEYASHYKNGVQTIKKIDDVLLHLEETISNRDAFLIANIIKYIDRCDKKGQYEDDIYKVADYLNRLVNKQFLNKK